MRARTLDGLRVCVLTTAHDTTDSRVVHREAVSLEEAGCEVTYYTAYEGACPVETVSYRRVPQGTIPGVAARLRWAASLARRLARSDFDVYHFHDVELLPVGVFLGRLTDGVVIYDVHENVEDVLAHKDILPESIRPYGARGASGIELALSRFVDGIVAASPDVADRFAWHDDVTVVTNYPRRSFAEATAREPDATRDDDGVQFVYCGLLSEGRGIVTLIDAIESVPEGYDVSLVLGGKYASEEFRETVARRTASTDRVDLVGWLPTLADVIDLFRESDVGLLCFHPDPNKTHAVHRSNKLFQYMATAIPAVVSDVGDWPRFVDDVGCGVAVDPEDPRAIADAMVGLADDPERRAELGRTGLEAALDRFNWETQRERLLDCYERLTTRRSTAESPEAGTVDRGHQTTDR